MKIFKIGAIAALWVGQAVAEILYAGVNSAGGEFAQQNLPGTFGVDYQFINDTAIDFFLNAGVNTVRLPFLLVLFNHRRHLARAYAGLSWHLAQIT